MNEENKLKVYLKNYFAIVLFLVIASFASAQNDSLKKLIPEIKISGFIDIFYAYDFNQPIGNSRQPFLYNHNRHNEFNLNLGIIKISALHEKYRSNLALHAGTYVEDNYKTEPGMLKMIYEANAGISLTKKNNLWLDAGIFGSHIGFESALSIDSWTLTRSMLAENSPYYLAGTKLTFKPNDHWEFAGIVCNGWQRIKRVSGNSLLSFCTQLTYSNSDKIKLNWSTFIGTDDPNISRRMRYFNNFYGQFQVAKRIGLIAGFDIGFQQKEKTSADYDSWYSPVIILKYDFNEHWRTAIRGEYYRDENGVIIPENTQNGFQTSGVSLNLDYIPFKNIMCRIEGRWLNSKDAIFNSQYSPRNNNIFIVGSIVVKLEK